MKIELSIDRALESRNRYNRPKGHWILKSDKDQWEKQIFIAGLTQGKNTIERIPTLRPKCRRKVSIVTYRKRIIDRDNLSVKAVLDALKRLGWIVDDSEKWIDLSQPTQISCGKHGKEKTIVTIEDI